MNVLVCCECSDRVTAQLRLLGHNAYSVDIKASENNSPWHYRADAIEVLESYPWDGVIAHPECTFMTNAGGRWLYLDGWYENGKDLQRWTDMYAAVDFFNKFVSWAQRHPDKKMIIENPIMHGYAKDRMLGAYTQIVHPWWFGDMESKATCLWLFNVKKLTKTNDVYAEMMKLPVSQRNRVHYMSPGPERSTERSRTSPNVAKALAHALVRV